MTKKERENASPSLKRFYIWSTVTPKKIYMIKLNVRLTVDSTIKKDMDELFDFQKFDRWNQFTSHPFHDYFSDLKIIRICTKIDVYDPDPIET